MNDGKSHWLLGSVYINPDDPRVLVPYHFKLGWALNFGSPRVVGALCWIWAMVLLAVIAAPIAAHRYSLVRNPTPLYWLSMAWLAALAVARLNNCIRWSDYRFISVTSYGCLAAGTGFAVQAVVNGPLVMWWGLHNLFLIQSLVLASVAAAAQTFGKWAALRLLWKIRPASSHLACARDGLLIGLGFTILEIALLYLSVAWADAPVGHLSVWERVSASVFHVYSAGLVAIALWSRRYWLIAFVVAIHTLIDFLAGAGGSLHMSFYALEIIFSMLAVVVWGVFLLEARTGRTEGRNETGLISQYETNHGTAD